MLMKVYAVWDSKVEAYLQPFFSPTDGAALRSFSDAVNDQQHQFSKHAPDYILFCIGSYDDQDGLLIPSDKGPRSMGCAVEYLNSEVK